MRKKSNTRFKKGSIPWNKGKTKKECPNLSKSGARKGNIPWNKEKKGEYKLWPNGRVFSQEHKRNMGLSKKGKPANPEGIKKMLAWRKANPELAKMDYWKGKKRPEETIAKFIKSHSGDKHYNWKGGISNNPYPRHFNRVLKRKIRERDGFVCVLCGMSEEESKKKYKRVLCVNHIDFDKQNCSNRNLNTLCVVCNIKVNYDREKWITYFQKLNAHIEPPRYISGSISNGGTKPSTFEGFHEAAKRLRADGHTVYSPPEWEQEEERSWEWYIAKDLLLILKEKPTLYMLRGWEQSQGARLEKQWAETLGLDIEYEN